MQDVGSFVRTKIFHDDEAARKEEQEELIKIARDSIGDTYIEEDPTVAEWLHSLAPTKAGAVQYFRDLFPSARWARRYNTHWLIGDAIAGVTVGLVVVPQAMAYALLARLPPAYGLYTTFTGACLYWIFGTSKDIVIGTTAVGSLLVGQVISSVEAEKPGVYKPEEIAHALSFLCGLILLFLGFFRLGWLIEFISYIPISAFVTSASITIISTQLPTCLGISGINTREAPYKVYINTLKGLPDAKLDAAIGISSIILLFAIQEFCAKMEVRQPSKKRMWSMINSLRLTFTILLYTFISFLVHRKSSSSESQKFRIVGKIEKGFSHASIPTMDAGLFSLVAKQLPAIVIILIVEHIAIAKNFGRMHGYTVIPSQEILAQGFANLLSPFVGGYVCTGSFGASAVLTKAGVRTPLAGLFSAIVLVLALYALTAVFYYIPNAALAGLIIHATCNLITPPDKLFKYWKIAPLELGIWIIGVLLAMFTNLETSIYVGIALTFAVMLIRMARTPGKFPGRVKVTRTLRSKPKSQNPNVSSSSDSVLDTEQKNTSISKDACRQRSRDIYLPLPSQSSHSKTPHNPRITISPPPPGIFIYRFSETFNYINQASHTDHLLTHILTHTRRTQADDGIRPQDRLWSDEPPPPRKLDTESDHSADELPILRAVVLDFSTVNVIDVTSVQGLVDMRNTLDRYAAPESVEWHFAGVHNRWTRRALAYAGFGRPGMADLDAWFPMYMVSTTFAGAVGEREQAVKGKSVRIGVRDEEMGEKVDSVDMRGKGCAAVEGDKRVVSVFGVDRPFFHVDLGDAVDAAVRSARRKSSGW